MCIYIYICFFEKSSFDLDLLDRYENNCQQRTFLLPLINLHELKIGITYRISNMKFVIVQNQRRIIADLDNKFAVFLPLPVNLFWSQNYDFFKKFVLEARLHRLGLRYLHEDMACRIEFVNI